MLCQLLLQRPDLCPLVASKHYKYFQLAGADEPSPPDWATEDLSDSISQVVFETKQTHRLTVFIDGLDEYEGDLESLTSFVKQLHSHERVKLCVSSRPSNIFRDEFKVCPSLRMELLTRPDIEKYVQGRIKTSPAFEELRIVEPAGIEKLKLEIIEKAEGVFLWVVLVVEKLITVARDNNDLQAIWKEFAALQPGLEDLYASMRRRMDKFLLEGASKMYQLLFSWKMVRDHSMSAPDSWMAINCHDPRELQDLPANDMKSTIVLALERRVAGHTGGMLQVRRNAPKATRTSVDFLHRTVFDWLRSIWPIVIRDGPTDYDPSLLLASTLVSQSRRYHVASDPVFAFTVTRDVFHFGRSCKDCIESRSNLLRIIGRLQQDELRRAILDQEYEDFEEFPLATLRSYVSLEHSCAPFLQALLENPAHSTFLEPPGMWSHMIPTSLRNKHKRQWLSPVIDGALTPYSSEAVKGLNNRLKIFNILLQTGFPPRKDLKKKIGEMIKMKSWRVLAETDKGLTCLALCACLSEIHPPKACAEILIRLADICDAPDDLRPSASQWINLVEACSGILKSTTYACIAEQFMAFHGPYVDEGYMDEAVDAARALLAVARVSSGVLSSVTLTGGRSCGWIAAVGLYFLGLKVEIRSADNATIYKSTTNDDSISILVIYGTAQSSNHVQVNNTAYSISSVDKIISSSEMRFDSIISGTVPWDSCLFTRFGESFQRLLRHKKQFRQLIAVIALVFQELIMSETNSVFSFDDQMNWFGFQSGQYGHGLWHSATSLFPELLQPGPNIDLNTNMSVQDSVEAYDEALDRLETFCKCRHCSGDSGAMRSYCLPILAETIIFLVWNISALELHADLKPYHSGLRFIYQYYSDDATTGSRFGRWYIRDALHETSQGYIGRFLPRLGLASVYHTAQFLFTNNLHPLDRCTAFTAASVGGLCFYFDILRNVSDGPEQAAKLHVLPGVIQTNAGRQYSFIADKTGTRSDGILGFDWRETRHSVEDSPQYRVDYKAILTDAVDGKISIPMLGTDTGSPDMQVTLLIEESTRGLLVDLRFISTAGACRVGAYTMLKEITGSSRLVRCNYRDCATVDQISSAISIVDGEGYVPWDPRPRIYLRRLAGNPLARCVGLLVKRDWKDATPILRQGECIPCCVMAAANMTYNQNSQSYVIV